MTLKLIVKDKGDRIDLWLSNHILNISRARIQKLIKTGNVIVNNEICKTKKEQVFLGDCLQIYLPSPKKLELMPEAIPLDILYEDEYLIVINKVAGMVVHPSPGHTEGTLVHALLHHCSYLSDVGEFHRPGIVHRLDKDTTGTIVVAKTAFVHQHLQKQIRDRTIKRQYIAVVHGVLKNKENNSYKIDKGVINLPIGRHPVDRKKMAIIPIDKNGRKAVTYWKILERLGNYSLVKFNLETGRTHQIRVHSSFLGCPVLGDPLYSSNRSFNINLSGQVLHAHKLSLVHPINLNRFEVTASLPLEFTKLLKSLRQKNN
ncbi:RluA family pseudouridine synthase [Candidatus Atelocyanobacterium thalassae]|uniref:Pseudouridine synthase n=1 Tax=cyanobacterium endosymbiont of Braarudosphaera bigelowii TaxID=1285375 RepID=A0ABN6K1V5_9CHRO|nr:RluA family pseudouridine synthase [Candidatus Atelocyanobacterium thalassa]BDA39983.1 ribosomal large subunit pseudouridine synthase D [cyanobacterium endosymbiont of Braarudosphaera bigelowii]